MASTVSIGSISDEEKRWIVVGICLTKVLTPPLRNTVATELQKWYNALCQPPNEIDKQVLRNYNKKLPPSKKLLQYKNINSNHVHSNPTAYDYTVKDPLSLAKLFLLPFMARFTGFDQTMDLSAVLAVMCEADPFVKTGGAVHAENVRSKIRNEWAHCNFSSWTKPMFNAAIQDMQLLVKTVSLSPAVEKKMCDDLDDWKNKGLKLCFGQPVDSFLLKLVTQEVDELRSAVESDTQMNAVLEKLDDIHSKLHYRIEELEKQQAKHAERLERHSGQLDHHSEQLDHHSEEHKHHTEQLEHHSEQLDHLSKESEHQGKILMRHSEELECLNKKVGTENKERENYSEFFDKKVPYGLRDLPRDMVERTAEVNEILRLLGSRSGNVVGICGMGGLGKTVLALAVAWTASVARQVIWLDIGETPDCLALINILIKVLGGAVSFTDILAAQAWVKTNTSDKDCLVVLDDVWNVDDLAVLDHLSGKCQLLITTRDVKIVHGSRGSAYKLQNMAQDESRTLLYQSAGIKQDELSKLSPKMHQIVEELLNKCRGLPLALSLVGTNLKGTLSEQTWTHILDGFKNSKLDEIHSLFPTVEYPYDNLMAAINVSFQSLEKSEQEKFLDFAIFPEDTNIPSDILELFWSTEEAGRTSCSPQERIDILETLEKKSLIQKGPELQGKTSYRVHDLLLDFVRTKLRAAGTLADVHCLFVKTLRGQCVNGEWTVTSSINQKDYYFKYLPYHLHSSEQPIELAQLFFDFHWLEQKVKQTNLPCLISDFRFLDTSSDDIKLLKSSLMLSGDIIEKTPNSFGPQILGRLQSWAEKYPRVKKLLEHVREKCTKTCSLLPLFYCLEVGGPEISRKKFESPVFSLATSNTSAGTIVISGLLNGSIKIHELETGRLLQELARHTGAVSCLALSHIGTILASGSEDQTARLWSMENYEQLFVMQGESPVSGLDFSADDERLFTGSEDGQLKIWSVSTSEPLNDVHAHDRQICGLCTTKDGRYIATASADHTIKLWKTNKLNLKATLVGHTSSVTCVVATESGNGTPMLVSSSRDSTLKVWDVRNYRAIRTLKVFYRPFATPILSVAVSQDAKHIISGEDYGMVRLWCFHTGNLLSSFEGHSRARSISCVTIIPDQLKALSGSRSLRVWDLDSSAHLKQDGSRGHHDIADIAVTRDGSRCVSASSDETFIIWNCTTGEVCFTLKDGMNKIKSVAISADGRHIVLKSRNYEKYSTNLKVWDLLNGNEINGIELDKNLEALIVCFSSDGTQVLIGYENERVSIWDWLSRDAPLKSVILPVSLTIEISCEGNMIYTCSKSMVACRIDLDSLKVSTIRQGPYPTYRPVIVLPNGEAALSGTLSDNSLIYWDFHMQEVKYNTGHPDDSIITAIDITSNGKLVLSGSSSGTITLVNLESSNIVQTFAKTETGAGIRFVNVLSDDARFVIVDETNTIEFKTFDNIEAGLVLGKPRLKVTCITTLGLNYVLIGCENGELLLLNLHLKQYQYEHHAHLEAVSQVKSIPRDISLRFASGSVSGSLKLWKLVETVSPSFMLVWSHDNIHPTAITALAFVPNSDEIVIGSHYDSKVNRINAAGIVDTFNPSSSGHQMCNTNKALRVVDNAIISVTYPDESGVSELRECAFGHYNSYSCSYKSVSTYIERLFPVKNASNHVAVVYIGENSLLIWNFKSGTILRRLHVHEARYFTAFAFVPGGEFLLLGSHNKTLKLWNLQNGQFVEEFRFDQVVNAIECASNGMVCVGLRDGLVCFLRLNYLSCHSGQLKE